MVVFKKAIPRRTFLRGLGTTVALPLLDAMVPAFATAADTAARSPLRMGIVYSPNGMWPMDKWTPKTTGTAYEITPNLEPFTPFREQMLVLSGLAHNEARTLPGDQGGDHALAVGSYLSGVRPKRTAGKDLRAGITLDQMIAQETGRHTQLGSLEIALVPSGIVGSCEPGYSCAYMSSISWRTPTTPLPLEYQPRAVFERLFGDSDTTDPAARRAQNRTNRSILDSMAEEAASMAKWFGPTDRGKLTEYLDAIRDVERRIETAEAQSSREMPTYERPVGVPDSYPEWSNLMCDLQVLAYQADLTRVTTFLMAREGPWGSRGYPELGFTDQHHALSHHQNDEVKVAKLYQINLHHAKLFSYFLAKLKATPDGDGSLLDRSLILYGSGMSQGNGHVHKDLPALLVGGGAGLKGGSHIRFPEDTPMANLYVTLLDKFGIHVDGFGDSKEALELPFKA